jgi:diaminohydroxyphosphoribosylaminopyrimidine deaminase/5-amino-6-(5-phosphoribosylamino)uracil reductase
MRRCLELATRGYPHPNPYVGAVLVASDGAIVGEGYHKLAGGDHAEVNCLKNFKKNGLDKKFAPKDLTLYVNLEPCCHFGKTPPCVDAIKKFGVKKLMFAITDPNPEVAGKGARELRKAGVNVQQGVLKLESEKQNEQFIQFHKTHKPFLAIKVATTMDGKIAAHSREPMWITSPAMRAFTRALRSRYQAIIIGIGTVIADNPHLGARQRGARDPLRIVLDSELRIPLSSQVLRDSQVIIACANRAGTHKQKALQKQGIRVWVCKSGKQGGVDLFELANKMYDAKIISALVEGGSGVISSFLAARLANKIYWAIAPKIMGDDLGVPALSFQTVQTGEDLLSLQNISHKIIGEDVLIEGYIRYR